MLRAWSHVPSLAAGSMGQLCWLLGGASVQDGAFPSHSMGRTGRKTCSALKRPCNGSRDRSRNICSEGRTS